MGAGLQYALNNPVLNAYMTGLKIRQQQEQQQFQNQFQQQQAETQQNQFASQQDMMKQQLAAYKEHAQAELAHQQAQLNEEQKRNLLEATQQAGQRVAAGSLQLPQAPTALQSPQASQTPPGPGVLNTPGQQFQAPSGPSTQSPMASQIAPTQVPTGAPANPIINYGGYNVDTTGFQTPKDLIANQRAANDEAARAAGVKAGSEAAAKQPYDLAYLQKQLDTSAANALNLENVRAGHEMERSKNQISAQLTGDRIRANAETDAARIHTMGGFDPNDPNSTSMFASAVQARGNGTLDPKNYSKQQLALMDQHLMAVGQQSVDPSVIKSLNGLHAIDTTRGLLEDYANNHAHSSQLGAVANAARALAPGDLKTFQDQINAQAPLVTRNIEGVTRLNQAELQQMIKGLGGPGSGETKENLLKRIKGLDDQVSDKATKQILGGIPQSQKTRILLNNGFNADGTTAAQAASRPSGSMDFTFNGKTYSFPNVDALNTFKKTMGIQ
jgi:hypothetical protein